MRTWKNKIPLIILVGISILAIFTITPTWASENSAKLHVSAWLVRIWLSLIGGTFVVAGVILAMESHAHEHSLEPVRTPEGGLTVQRIKQLSYRKIAQGLLAVIFGSAFFVSATFLLPDMHTGHSGLGKIIERYKGYRSSVTKIHQQ
ncbi:MAG: hypothetical protein A2511_07470 [Deltaproteobacteria bacterium RIFOXYD12_FULL_50_9]|nr:MAG: hypothetical protein A2511_07470 [Deltaproteobacteria bacterium RIFOXYD12_FULL_50_9]